MKTYRLSVEDARLHQPLHPSRTTWRNNYGGLMMNIIFKEWPTVGWMDVVLVEQAGRKRRSTDWHAWEEVRP